MESTPAGFFSPGDVDRLNAEIDGVRASNAAIGRAQAERIRALATIAEIAVAQTSRLPSRASRLRDMPVRSVAAELAAATRQHDRTMQRELDEAFVLTTRLAATVSALADGTISMRHVSAILDAGMTIGDPGVRGAWESTVLEFAAGQSPGRTRAYALELAEAVDPETMTERFSRAVLSRGVSVSQLADGMSQLVVILPTTLARGIADRIGRMARRLREVALAEAERAAASASASNAAAAAAADATATASASAAAGADGADTGPSAGAAVAAGVAAAPRCAAAPGDGSNPMVVDTRTLSQIEADVICDLLLTSAPAADPTSDDDAAGELGAISASVQILIPATVLTGASDGGATLDGRAPIDADTARRLAGDAPGWDRLLLHPVTGTVVEVDRYEPTAAQRRFLRARDRHCRAPGCRQPAHRCQIDHNHEHHDGGRTALGNLAHLCVRHHTLKSETPWTVHQRPDGTLEFHSPLGNTYEDPPPPRVMFVPTGDPPPF
ncbi:DUF222 domain-containing protein [Microbacterium sp. 1P10UB]|uniref:HNH endonuclease signature motif containing protein n=1 Tax=unclassified Microbacterium TaxID=2609290 RepID=UPI0039A31E56